MGNTEFPSQFSQKEIQKLYARFKQIDEDNSGDLDPEEIFNVPELNQNPLVKRVISIFNKNKDGKISFGEFLSGTCPLNFRPRSFIRNRLRKKALVRIQNLRYRWRRVHNKWVTVHCPENDGWKQLDWLAVATACGQNHHQGRFGNFEVIAGLRWENILPRVQKHGQGLRHRRQTQNQQDLMTVPFYLHSFKLFMNEF